MCAGALVSLSIGLHGQTQPRRTPAATTKPAAAGSDGTIYIGTYAGNIEIVDEATEKMIGEIPLKTGIPGDLHAVRRPHRRFYVLDATHEKVEIVDRVKRETIDSFTLSRGHARRCASGTCSPIRTTSS